jgi:hypothetical protein
VVRSLKFRRFDSELRFARRFRRGENVTKKAELLFAFSCNCKDIFRPIMSAAIPQTALRDSRLCSDKKLICRPHNAAAHLRDSSRNKTQNYHT